MCLKRFVVTDILTWFDWYVLWMISRWLLCLIPGWYSHYLCHLLFVMLVIIRSMCRRETGVLNQCSYGYIKGLSLRMHMSKVVFNQPLQSFNIYVWEKCSLCITNQPTFPKQDECHETNQNGRATGGHVGGWAGLHWEFIEATVTPVAQHIGPSTDHYRTAERKEKGETLHACYLNTNHQSVVTLR